MSRATARANANIALVKYWGKRDPALNLPAAGSISLTLDGLGTETAVRFGEAERDELRIDGRPAAAGALARALRVVDLVRTRAGLTAPVSIESRNDFPTGAGLASSASGLAALTVAAAHAAGLELPSAELSAIARRGSGSACRSVFGGYVEWLPGRADDGSDSHGVPLHPPEHWDLRCVVALVEEGPKPVGSSRGMLHTAATSPYHRAFVETSAADLDEARAAIGGRDLERLARVAERSCLRMHGDMMAADPALVYLTPASWEVIEAARQLRAGGLGVFFTVDAGPNVKLFCEPTVEAAVEQAARSLPGVRRVILARPGDGARVVR